MIFRKNNLNIGIGLGLVVPLLVFGICYLLFQTGILPLKLRTIALIGICANIFTSGQFRRNRAHHSVRGTMIATILLCGLWVFWFLNEILLELDLAKQ